VDIEVQDGWSLIRPAAGTLVVEHKEVLGADLE